MSSAVHNHICVTYDISKQMLYVHLNYLCDEYYSTLSWIDNNLTTAKIYSIAINICKLIEDNPNVMGALQIKLLH